MRAPKLRLHCALHWPHTHPAIISSSPIVTWDAWYYDFGGITHMDYYIRRVRGRTVVLLLMYTPYSQGDLVRDPLRVLASFREKPEP
jgi:hypothetical protein